jgi:hypothetical protein
VDERVHYIRMVNCSSLFFYSGNFAKRWGKNKKIKNEVIIDDFNCQK